MELDVREVELSRGEILVFYCRLLNLNLIRIELESPGCSGFEVKTSRPGASNGQQFPCPAFNSSIIIDF